MGNPPQPAPEPLTGSKIRSQVASNGKLARPTNRFGYDTLAHKMPIMVGFNVPAFRILDVLACEMEWYGMTYPNSYATVERSIQPLPASTQNPTDLPDSSYRERDNVKWSIYASKTFGNRVRICFQAARDHVRNETPFAQSFDRKEAFRDKHGWSWMAKLGVLF